VLGEVSVVGVVEGIGERLGKPDALAELADGKQPGGAAFEALLVLEQEAGGIRGAISGFS
jgi:hypothetical protein